MKKIIRQISIVGFILIATSISVFATCNHTCMGGEGGNPGNSGTTETEAPLDGGLLAVLAAAGVSYYVVRKKKKNDQ